MDGRDVDGQYAGDRRQWAQERVHVNAVRPVRGGGRHLWQDLYALELRSTANSREDVLEFFKNSFLKFCVFLRFLVDLEVIERSGRPVGRIST